MRSSLLSAAVLAGRAAATTAAADPGFFGTSGLMMAPTAEARPRVTAAFGAHFDAARYRGGAGRACGRAYELRSSLAAPGRPPGRRSADGRPFPRRRPELAESLVGAMPFK